MNQLNLFGEDFIKVNKVEATKQKEKANSKKTSTSSKNEKGAQKTAAAAPKKKDIKVNADWSIHYYSNSFAITEFVQEIPEEGISTEQLREAMVLEFYEMTKDRTRFDYDAENKRLFPKITGGDKG